MNEVAVIPPKPLTVIERAVQVFAAVPSEEALRELAKKSATITEITNEAGKDQCHASRMVLKNTRLEIERVGEEGREDAVQTSKAIIALQKARIAITKPEEDRLAAIQKAWDDRVAAEKERKIQAEIARVANIQERITELRGCQTLSPSNGSALVAEHIADLEAIPVDATFDEFEQQAADAKVAALVRLKAIHAAAVAHEAEQARIVEERAELAKLRAESAERERVAEENRQKQAAIDQAARDAEAARVAEANRLERERIAKEEAAAQAKRDAETAAQAAIDKANRERNEAALQEIQAIHHQLIIADTGRRPYCKGGDLESIDWVIDGTEKWELTEERFGVLYPAAVKAKETTLAALRQKRVDFLARQETAAEALRQAELAAKNTADREQLEREQAAARKAAEPKPEPVKTRIVERPSAAQLIALISGHYSVTPAMAEKWLRSIKWEREAA